MTLLWAGPLPLRLSGPLAPGLAGPPALGLAEPPVLGLAEPRILGLPERRDSLLGPGRLVTVAVLVAVLRRLFLITVRAWHTAGGTEVPTARIGLLAIVARHRVPGWGRGALRRGRADSEG